MRYLHLIPYTTIAFLLTVFLMAGCSRSVDSRLLEINKIVENYPDSAMIMLKSLNDSVLQNETDRNVRSILLTEARYMSGIDDTDDALITEASDYFDDNLSNMWRMRAYYMKGIILNNACSYGTALIALSEAEKSIAENNDKLWAARIHRSMGDSFDGISNARNAIDYYRKSHDEFKAAGRMDYVGYAMFDVCRSYENIAKNDSCILMARRIIEFTEEYPDSILLYYALGALGKAQLMTRDYDGAVETLNKAASFNRDGGRKSIILENLGLAYLEKGDIRNAIECNEILHNVDTTRKHLAWRIAENQGDFPKAFKDYKAFSDKNFTLYLDWERRNQEKQLFDSYSILQKEAALEGMMKDRWIIILSFSCLFLLLGGVIVFLRLREIRLQKQILLDQATDLKNEIENTHGRTTSISQRLEEQTALVKSRDMAIREARENLKESLKSEFYVIDTLAKEYYDMGDDRSGREKIYSKVNRLVCDIRDDKNVMARLEKTVNSRLDNLMHKFDKDFPDIKTRDRDLFIYIVLDFSGKSIGFFMGISYDLVYARKRALKKEISNSDCKNAAYYLEFF